MSLQRWKRIPGNLLLNTGTAVGSSGTILRTELQPTPTAVTSRKTHGGAQAFDVNLPLTGTPGIECRSGGATNDYTMIIKFAGPVSVTGSPQAQVTSGTGQVGTGGTGNGGAVTVTGYAVTVPLTNVGNAQ